MHHRIATDVLPRLRRAWTAGLLLLTIAGILAGCDKREGRSKDSYQLIEYIEVEGECFEDHVKQPAPYTGSLVHWYNVTKDLHSRYGSVHHADHQARREKRVEQREKPYTYAPPFTIEFSDLRPEDLKGDTLRLAGVSTRYEEYKSTAVTVYMYESTCVLRVIRRSDHIPRTTQEPKKE